MEGLDRRDERRRSFELRLRLPWATFRLAHPMGGDRDRITRTQIDGANWLVCHAPFAFQKQGDAPLGWVVDAGRLVVLGERGHFCNVALPSTDAVAAAIPMANPVFELELKKTDQPTNRMSKPKLIPTSRWTLRDDVRPLEQELADDSVPYTPLKRVEC